MASGAPDSAAGRPDVFISYSRQDLGVAKRVEEALSAGGYRVWIDKRGLQPGDQWDAEITRAARTCRLLLLLSSPASMASDWVLGEVRLVAERQPRPPILVAELETASVNDGLAPILAGLQRADLIGLSVEAVVTRLLSVVQTIISPSEAVADPGPSLKGRRMATVEGAITWLAAADQAETVVVGYSGGLALAGPGSAVTPLPINDIPPDVSNGSLSGDGRRLLLVADQSPVVVDLVTATRLDRLRGHVGAVTAGVLVADGRFAVTGGADGRVLVHPVGDPSGRRLLAEGTPVAGLAAIAEETILVLRSDGALDLVDRGEGPTAPQRVDGVHPVVAVAGHEARATALVTDGSTLQWVEPSGCSAVTFVGDVRGISVGRQSAGVLTSEGVAPVRAREVDAPPLVGSTQATAANCLATAYGDRLVSGSLDGTVTLWSFAH